MTSQSDVCSTVITSSRELALFKDPSTTYTDEFRQHCRNHYRDNIGDGPENLATPTARVLKPHSTPATLIWLEENYELADGVCIPRSVLYTHYVDFCARNNVQPVNAASFGKIIRQQFPQLTTRRLGTRGQSRYHYYGIGVRESSPYYHTSYSKKGANCTDSAMKRETRENITKQHSSGIYSPRSARGTMLPEFPNLKEIVLPPSLDNSKIATFMMMYRTHCQRILDTIIRANFDEVQTFLLHFWQGVPPHLSPLLESNAFVNLIGVCDSILYKTVANVLLPSVLQALPESLTKVLRKFAQELDCWLKVALFGLPETLRTVKFELARRFVHILKRQTSLSHLTQASRMVVHNLEITNQMLNDWRQLDINSICRETLCTNGHNESTDMLRKACQDFQQLLEEEAQIENYFEWLERLLQKCVLIPSLKNRSLTRLFSRQFLLHWTSFGARVIRDLTLHNAASFGSFHLVRLMLDDYILYLIEYVQVEEQIREFLTSVPSDAPPRFVEAFFSDAELSDAQQILNTDFEVSSTSDNPADYCVENSLCNGGAHQESVAVENINNSEISPQQIAYQSTYHGYYSNGDVHNQHRYQTANGWYQNGYDYQHSDETPSNVLIPVVNNDQENIQQNIQHPQYHHDVSYSVDATIYGPFERT